MKRVIKEAFLASLPVLAGYVTIGLAFGLLFCSNGLPGIWAVFSSVVVYAGSMQFVSVGVLSSGLGVWQVVFMTFAVNLRHIAYGIPLIEKFKNMSIIKKWYMAFSLSDETYALLVQDKVPQGIKAEEYFFAIALLNQAYWITGTLLGVLLGSALPFNMEGIEFAMTALFICIATEQWVTMPSRKPAIAGMGLSVLSLVLFGASSMLLPALFLIVTALFLLRPSLETAFSEKNVGGKVDE